MYRRAFDKQNLVSLTASCHANYSHMVVCTQLEGFQEIHLKGMTGVLEF